MKKFLKFALKSQWKTILIILGLVALQTFFQIEIIKLFAAALKDVESEKVNSLFDNVHLMLIYTILSMIAIYAISFLSTKVSSKAAYDTREKIFHILMNLPDGEIDKFKITGLITRSTRGIYSEQVFITVFLKNFLIIPFVFIGIVIEIALIDAIFAAVFAAVIIIMFLILIFKLKQVTAIYFKAKGTYGKLNALFLSKINNLANNIPFKKQKASDEFEKACEDSYDKNILYQLSQYYLGPILLLFLAVIVVVLLALMVLGYPICFKAEAFDSVVIIQYILYFIATLAVIPTMIEIWPRSYATSVRLEEVLNLKDKIIKTKNNNDNSKRIEITEEDIENDDNHILVDRKRIIQKFNKVLGQHRTKVIISMILVTISTLCIAYAPKVAGNIIDLILLNSDPSNNHKIFINVMVLFALYSIGYLFKLPSSRLMAFIGEKIAYNLRMELFEKLDIIDSKFIQNAKGQILSRLNNDLMNVREFASMHISEIFAKFLSIIFVIILILTTDWRLGLIYVMTLPIYIICFYWSDIKSKAHYENHQRHLGRMMGYFERSLTNRGMSHEEGLVKINKGVSDCYVKSRNISNILMPVTTLLTNLSNIIVYILGLNFLITNEIQLGTLLAVIIYGQLLSNPLKKISASIIFLETSFSSLKRIFAIIEYRKK